MLGSRADLLEELDDVVERCLARVAREAGVGHGVLGQDLDLVSLHGLADVRDVHVGGKLLDGGDSGIGGLVGAHARGVNAHGDGNLGQALGANRLVELHGDRQQHGASDAVRGVVVSGQGVSHGVVDTQADVGEAHAGDILTKSHALAAGAGLTGLGLGNGVAQVLADQLNSLKVEHVGELPGTLGGVALDGVGQSVHASGSGKAGGHGSHHVGVDDGDLGGVVGVDAHELADLLGVGDDVVDGHLGSSTGGRRHGDGEHGVVLSGSNALEAADIGELGVVDNDADGLSGVHGGAATDGHDSVSLGGLEGLDAVLDVLDGGVGLNLGVEAPSDAGGVELVGHLSGNAKLDQVGIGADEDLLVAATLELAGDLLDGAGTMIRNGIENETISH